MKKPERKRRPPKASISSDPPRRAVVPQLAATAAAPPKPVEDLSWKTDPDLRAFACLLSYEAGWFTDPVAMVWTFGADKVIEVTRPQDNQSVVMASRGPLTMSAEACISEIRRRWGFARGDAVEVFCFPDRAPQIAELVLGPHAQYLRQLARKTWFDGIQAPNTDAAIEVLAASFVQICRTLAARIDTANTGDQSASATQTRAVARARVLDLINPPSRNI